MGLYNWLCEERQQYVVCDSPLAKSRDRLNDALRKAGARGAEPLPFGTATRVMLRREDVPFIESNGFTVRLEVPSFDP